MSRYRRHNGDIEKDPTAYCIKCGGAKIKREQHTTQDFDEKGWYSPITLTCENIKCGFSWQEKFLLQNA